MKGVLPFVVYLVASAALLVGQQTAPPPTFHAGVDLLQLDVSVLDRHRQPVRDLKATDFTVRIDGRVRPIVAFTPVDVPVAPMNTHAAWTRDVAPDVTSNAISDEGRLVVIFIDHTLKPEMTPAARTIARAVVGAMGPADQAAVIFVGDGRPQNFTGDHARLVGAIDSPFMGGFSSPDIQCYCSACTMDFMSNVVENLRAVPQRRKVLIYVGTHVATQAIGPCAVTLKIARERLFKALGRTNIAVYSIDPSGLKTGMNMADVHGVPPNIVGISGGDLTIGILPSRTGGRVVAADNTPEVEIPTIFAESGTYYVLGIERPIGRADQHDQSVEVNVNRPGLKVTAQRVYATAPLQSPVVKPAPVVPNGPSTSLVGALATVWPATALPLRVTAAAFAMPGSPTATVAVIADADPIHPRPGAPVATSTARGVLVAAFDRDGRALATHYQTVTAPADRPFEILSRLALPPGHYEIRAAMESIPDDVRGSVYTYVDVPNVSKDPLSMSGIVLGHADASAIPGGQATMFADVLPFAPTADRAFTPTSRIAAFARVYQGGNDPPKAVQITTRIVADDDRHVLDETTALASATFSGARSTDYRLDLPLARLTPGEYLLTITVQMAEHVTHGDVRFTVQ